MKSIIWAPQARADLRRLDRQVAVRILRALERYAETGHGDVTRLRGHRADFRLRVGGWRLRFQFAPPDTIRVLSVRLRDEAY